MGAGKRLNGRGKKLGEEKSRKKVGAPGILLLTDQFRNHLKSLPVIGHKKYFCAQSQARILNGFGTGRLREESQGLLLSFFFFFFVFYCFYLQVYKGLAKKYHSIVHF